MAGLALLFLAVRPLSRPSIRMDGHGYYSTLATVLFDHDLDFTNEMAHTDNFYRRNWYASPKGSGYVNPYPIGAALLWSPVVAISYALDPKRDRYHDPTRWVGTSPAFGRRYVVTIAIATALEAIAGAALLYRGARRLASPRACALGVLGATLGTPFVYYALAEPSYAHVASFLACAALLVASLSPGRSLRSFLLLGLLWGLVALIRYQDAVLGVLAAPKLLHEAARLRRERSASSLGRIAVFAVAGLAVLSIQVAFWQRVFGEPYVTAVTVAVDWTHPHVLPFLFSTWAGALLWSPILAVGIGGLWLCPDRGMRWALIAAVALQVYVSAAASDWWGSASFGARRLVAIAPLAGLGVALAVDRFATSRRRTAIALAVVGVAVVWNLRVAHYTVVGLIPSNVRNPGEFVRDYPVGHPYREPWAQWDYARFAAEIAGAERRMWRRR